MEDNHWNVGLSMKEKGFILEKTRLMSMEFTKLKTSVMKSKMNYDDRTKVLNFLKPFDQRIKEILNISESFAESLIEASSADVWSYSSIYHFYLSITIHPSYAALQWLQFPFLYHRTLQSLLQPRLCLLHNQRILPFRVVFLQPTHR